MPTNRFVLCCLLALATGVGRAASASIPLTVTQHGYLTQDSGGGPTPVNGDHALTFRLYADGTAIWEETILVNVRAGYYSVLLGLTEPLDAATLLAASETLLGISIDGAAELTPRFPVSAVPFALSASLAERAFDLDCTGCVPAASVAFGYAGSASPGGAAQELECSAACVGTTELDNAAVNTAKLAPNAVTSAQIADGAVGSADLAAGAVTPAKLAPCSANQLLRYGASGWTCSSAVTILDNGNVGIGTSAPTAPLQVAGGVRLGPQGRVQLGWYHNSEVRTHNYLHLKTGLWAGGSPTGNTHYIMGGFHATGYNYTGESIDSYWMFHNWSGALHALVVRNQGSYPYAHSAYVSADGYVVLVANYTTASYIGATFDLIQSFGGYPWVDFGVTATAQSNSATGVF